MLCEPKDYTCIYLGISASLLFDAGVSMKDVKERLGHSDITTTMNIYTHVTKKKAKETAVDFANYMES